MIGRRLGWLGLEHDSYVRIASGDPSKVRADVRRRLQNAGFTGEPAMHLQFEGQY